VACHVAAACDEVDMLVADRTFGNLAATVVHLWNKTLSRLMSWGTGWGKYTDNSKEYLAATCYKVRCMIRGYRHAHTHTHTHVLAHTHAACALTTRTAHINTPTSHTH
jgi:hypothetical protein